MNIASKLGIGLFAAGILAAGAAELASINKPADLTTPKAVTEANGVLSGKGNKYLFSRKLVKIDPAKKYQISGEFRTAAGPSGLVYLGFAPCDAKGNITQARAVNTVANTQTEVAEDAKKGSKTIKVKDASKWNKTSKYSWMVFGAKDDFSDLPNMNAVSTVPQSFKQDGDVWEVALKTPLKADIAAGTKVRQQLDGASYMYSAGAFKVGDKWIARKGIAAGMAKNGNPSNKFWPGTVTARIVILVLGAKNDTVTEFRNIKVEEVK